MFGKIAHWAGTDIDALGKAPASTARVVADAVDGQPPEDQASVKKLAEALVAALKIEAQKSGGPFGLIIKKLEALEVQLGRITVTEGIGVCLGDMKAPGAFTVGPINVGPPSGKTDR